MIGQVIYKRVSNDVNQLLDTDRRRQWSLLHRKSFNSVHFIPIGVKCSIALMNILKHLINTTVCFVVNQIYSVVGNSKMWSTAVLAWHLDLCPWDTSNLKISYAILIFVCGYKIKRIFNFAFIVKIESIIDVLNIQ